MGLTRDDNTAQFQIQSFQPGRIQVNDVVYTSSIIVSSDRLIKNWRPQIISELTRDDLSIIIDLSPAILLLGTGGDLTFPDLDVYGDLINEGIGVEVMDTRAACRTFAALTAENRNVVAALIIK